MKLRNDIEMPKGKRIFGWKLQEYRFGSKTMKSLLKLEAAKTGGGSGLLGRTEAKQWCDDSHESLSWVEG